MSRSRVLLLALTALAGCGGDSSPAPDDEPVLGDYRPAPRGDLHPKVTGHRLLEIQRLGDQAGTSDDVVFGSDGSAVKIKAYGGGGYYAWRCRLDAAELASVRAAVRALPLDPAPKRPKERRESYYQVHPATFIVRWGKRSDAFTEDAVPPDGRPLVRHLERVLAGHEGTCRLTFGQRTH